MIVIPVAVGVMAAVGALADVCRRRQLEREAARLVGLGLIDPDRPWGTFTTTTVVNEGDKVTITRRRHNG